MVSRDEESSTREIAMQLFDLSLPVLRETDDEISIVDDYEDRREDLTVQVKLAPRGLWHRKAIGGVLTACGEDIDGNAVYLRDEKYTANDMCPTCFTPFERRGGSSSKTPADDTPDHTPLMRGRKK